MIQFYIYIIMISFFCFLDNILSAIRVGFAVYSQSVQLSIKNKYVKIHINMNI